jgi:hypothetical protein
MGDDALRARILARRAKLVAAALAASSLAAGAAACGGEVQQGDGGVDAAKDGQGDVSIPVPCLGAPQMDASPQPCLEPPLPTDAGDAGDG